MYKEDKIRFVHTEFSDTDSTESILGMDCTVSYGFRMYIGPTKVNARYKFSSELVEIKAYGFLVIRTLEFPTRMPENVKAILKYQGYDIIDHLNMAILNKDFGYLTAQNYEINYLMHKVKKAEYTGSYEVLCKAIREEASSWGEPVTDVAGRLLHGDTPGTIRRDPFAKAARLTLKKKLGPFRQNPFDTMIKALSKQDKDRGADM